MAEKLPSQKPWRRPLTWGLLLLVLAGLIWLVVEMTHPRPLRAIHGITIGRAHALNVALYTYAHDHGGRYPAGLSSTQVFQTLLDDDYIEDPRIVYTTMPGLKDKTPPTSKKLRPENVCFDITIPVDIHSPDDLPVVFSTGYRIDYATGDATPVRDDVARIGIVVAYRSMWTKFIKSTPDSGNVPGVVGSTLPATGPKYSQLTPDGPLPVAH